MPLSIAILIAIARLTYVAAMHLTNCLLEIEHDNRTGGTIVCSQLSLTRVSTVHSHGFSFRVGLSVKENNPQWLRVHMATGTLNKRQEHVNKHITLISVWLQLMQFLTVFAYITHIFLERNPSPTHGENL